MQPIQDLLNRIRWDRAFGRARFDIGYYDRVADTVFRISFERVHFVAGDHFCFEIADRDGTVHVIPFHRVRDVYRDGQRIWHREGH